MKKLRRQVEDALTTTTAAEPACDSAYIPDVFDAQARRKPLGPPCIPYVSTDQYVVRPLSMDYRGAGCGSFCTYPVQNPYGYEVPPNVCFPPGTTQANTREFFPGHNTYKTVMDPVTGHVYRPKPDESFCPRQFWNQGQATLPHVPLAGGDPNVPRHDHHRQSYQEDPIKAPQIPVADTTPDSSSTELRFANREYGYPFEDVEEAPTDSSAAINSRMCVLNKIFPGEQEVKSHRWVTDDRYWGEQRVANVYVKPYPSRSVKYTNSLYSTPYNSTQNMISTGILKNAYTGENYECFENQVQPPTSTTNQIPEYQLKQANPRLIWAMGGYNHHQPPPAKTEQPGYVFNPVSARGGAPPFGSSTFADDIRSQEEQIALRDVFNNQDGNLPCEPSLYGERPQGYFGLVPRLRTVPYLPPTNELSKEGYMPVADNLNPDQRQREQWTGKFYARRDPLLATRTPLPGLVNGVEAISEIPLETDHVFHEGLERGYVGPVSGSQNAGDTLVSQHNIRQTLKSEATLPVGPAEGAPQHSTQASNQQLRTTYKGQSYARTPAAAARDFANGQVMEGVRLRTTTKNPQTYRTAPIEPNIRAGIIVTDKTVRYSLKTAAAENPFRLAGNPSMEAGSVIASLTTLKPTLKETMQETFPVTNAEGDDAGYVLVDKNLRHTWRTVDTDREFVPPVDAGRMGDNTGPGATSTTQHRGCLPLAYLPGASMLPTGVGGSTARIVQPLQRRVRYTKEDVIKPLGPEQLPESRMLYIPAVRSTLRSEQERQELSDDLCDF
uniref:Uncharacterized protein n=1 Tax=viral metagenome TaxID=1070528 RepID=A0A6C0BNN0_9ZZZZ